MKQQCFLVEYRKLDADLPQQLLINQRPWLVVGLLLAIIFLIATGYAYVHHQKKSATRSPGMHNVSLNQTKG